jgi:hypothetical protein
MFAEADSGLAIDPRRCSLLRAAGFDFDAFTGGACPLQVTVVEATHLPRSFGLEPVVAPTESLKVFGCRWTATGWVLVVERLDVVEVAQVSGLGAVRETACAIPSLDEFGERIARPVGVR